MQWVGTVIIIFFGMLDGTLQGRLASFQFETKDVGSVARLRRRVWEEDRCGWEKVAFCTFLGPLAGKQRTAVRDVETFVWFPIFYLEGDLSSISGSESDSEEGADSNNITATDNETWPESSGGTGRPSTKIIFQNSAGQYLSVHRCILQGKSAQVWIQYCSICTNRDLSNFFSVALKSDDEQDAGSSLKNINKKTLWVILMTGGGHFVGSIFQGWDKGFFGSQKPKNILIQYNIQPVLQKRSPSAQNLPSIHSPSKARHRSRPEGFSEPQPCTKVCGSCAEAI